MKLKADELLTPRQREVYRLLLQGYSDVKISKLLIITEWTAKAHRHNIYTKLAISSIHDLIHDFYLREFKLDGLGLFVD